MNGMAGSRTAVDTVVWLSEDAFEGDPEHSLLANLRDLHDEDWTALPAGANAKRSIAEIVEHVAWAKWMYTDYAFGPASLAGDQPPMVPAGGARSRPRDELLAWLGEGHGRWLAAVRALADDSELDRPRLANWGEYLATRTLVRILLAHDLYHAGEINHLRALLHGSDGWPY
jgi:DinB family protein